MSETIARAILERCSAGDVLQLFLTTNVNIAGKFLGIEDGIVTISAEKGPILIDVSMVYMVAQLGRVQVIPALVIPNGGAQETKQ